MDRDLRPRIGYFQIASYAISVFLTVLLIVAFAAMCGGCAAFMGQSPTARTGTVTFRSRVYPPPVDHFSHVHSSGPLVSYLDQATNGTFTVRNGQDWGMHFRLDCGFYEPEFDVPAHTSQDVLVDTTLAHRDEDLCTVLESYRIF